jgi:cysteine-rich repeat protein
MDAACGDGFKQPGEECDDGNDVDTDACTSACTEATCGDGFKQPGEGCDDGNDVDDDACSNSCVPGGLRVFVTKGTFDGDLGGIAGADAKCQAAADGADLGGTWMAWISADQDSNSPSARFTGPKDKPFFRVDLVKIADDWATLTDGGIDAPIDRDQFGEGVGNTSRVWTNVDPDGTNNNTIDCNEWQSDANWRSGNVGTRTHTDARWTSDGSRNCDTQRRLYCFEQ